MNGIISQSQENRERYPYAQREMYELFGQQGEPEYYLGTLRHVVAGTPSLTWGIERREG